MQPRQYLYLSLAALTLVGCQKDDNNGPTGPEPIPAGDHHESIEGGVGNVAWRLKTPKKDGEETIMRLKKNWRKDSYDLMITKTCGPDSKVAINTPVGAGASGFAVESSVMVKNRKGCSLEILKDIYSTKKGIGTLLLKPQDDRDNPVTYERVADQDLQYSCSFPSDYPLGTVCKEIYSDEQERNVCENLGGYVHDEPCRRVQPYISFHRTCSEHRVQNGKLQSSFTYFYNMKLDKDVCKDFKD